MQIVTERDNSDLMVKILVFGGCHVGSYPPFGIIDLLRDRYPKITAIPHVKASQIDRISTKIRDENPDLIVFQIGNYENPYPLFNRLKKASLRRIGIRKPDSGSEMPYLKAIPLPFKIGLDRILYKIGLGIGNPRSFNKQFEKLLLEVAPLFPGRLLVLSPFPSKDLWIGRGRSLANDVMLKLCEKASVRYIDVINLNGLKGANIFSTGDDMHFNAVGHRILFESVYPEIQCLLLSQKDKQTE